MPTTMVGKRNDDFTLNIDLAPTILNAAQIPTPKVMQGRDLSILYRTRADPSNDKPVDWRDEFYYEWFTGEMASRVFFRPRAD